MSENEVASSSQSDNDPDYEETEEGQAHQEESEEETEESEEEEEEEEEENEEEQRHEEEEEEESQDELDELESGSEENEVCDIDEIDSLVIDKKMTPKEIIDLAFSDFPNKEKRWKKNTFTIELQPFYNFDVNKHVDYVQMVRDCDFICDNEDEDHDHTRTFYFCDRTSSFISFCEFLKNKFPKFFKGIDIVIVHKGKTERHFNF
jgi:hypothetical protein